VTALVTTGLQDGTASAGAHTGTETVRFGALTLIWLVCTLHKNLFSNFSLGTSRYPLGVADVLRTDYLNRNPIQFEKNFVGGVGWRSSQYEEGGYSPDLACG